MGKILILERLGMYSIKEIGVRTSLTELKELIGGWPERAVVCPPQYVDRMINAPNTDTGLQLWCDSDGHPKRLDLTWYRTSDGAPIVGRAIWISYKDVIRDMEPDWELTSLPESHFDALVKMYQAEGWAELKYSDESISGSAIMSGGEAGES